MGDGRGRGRLHRAPRRGRRPDRPLWRGGRPAAVDALLDDGGADRVRLTRSAREALGAARAKGWICAIVTNGRVAQQEAKFRRTGLDQLVHDWAVSEGVGHQNPDPRIFRAAADDIEAHLAGAWVIGDSPHADIAGAHALGLRSAWVTDGRVWAQDAYRSTHVARDVAAAIRHAITASE
ncbi:HAD-IA family hydrolase [Streptomyces sp. Edi4]|uniref:HAD family hydrolase n=1 Tax=Streptomyces sp. Edi4 TaxID=3162527 RepID=UPI003306486B